MSRTGAYLAGRPLAVLDVVAAQVAACAPPLVARPLVGCQPHLTACRARRQHWRLSALRLTVHSVVVGTAEEILAGRLGAAFVAADRPHLRSGGADGRAVHGGTPTLGVGHLAATLAAGLHVISRGCGRPRTLDARPSYPRGSAAGEGHCLTSARGEPRVDASDHDTWQCGRKRLPGHSSSRGVRRRVTAGCRTNPLHRDGRGRCGRHA